MKKVILGTTMMVMLFACSSSEEKTVSDDETVTEEITIEDKIEGEEKTDESQKDSDGMIDDVEELGNDVDSLLNEI